MGESMIDTMKAAPIWLIWKSILEQGKSKPRKVPYYVNNTPRSGVLDSPQDRAQLVTYNDAVIAFEQSCGFYAGLAIALGPDGRGGHWQGIDLDNIEPNGLSDIANRWVRGDCAGWGYIEGSPSGNGAHIIGYGRSFQSLGSNSSGIEAYAGGRFFTFTGASALRESPCQPVDLAPYVEQHLIPRHGAARSESAGTSAGAKVRVDAKVVTDLRSAVFHLHSDDRSLWVAIGQALYELGDTGRGLWMDWSATSDKFDPKDAAKTWDSFDGARTGHQAVFKKAQDAGWINPASKAAQPDQPPPASPSTVTLEFAMSSDTATITLEYVLDPYLPAKCVVGFYGRGSSAKSSFLASIAAGISNSASTLWVSVEEPADWIKVRHIRCGGADQTLAVVKAVASKTDAQGRVIASSFNVYEHLEPAITTACAGFQQALKPPLRLVVLDTAVGLTGWAGKESPNDDAAVKRLLGYLQALADRNNLTIAVIGHANKGKHEHFADTVMGATAWTNSPRLSFVHATDLREEYSYVMRVAKTNLVTFGVTYKTEPVHTLYQREHGPDSVLVKVLPGPVVWGDHASMEMFMEATKKPNEDEDSNGGFEDFRKPSADGSIEIVTVVTDLVQATAPGGQIKRSDVEERVGRPIERRLWLKVDKFLEMSPLVYVMRGEKNKVLYMRP